MELGTITREVFVDASPEVVFEVVSSPDHITQWWPDEAHYEATEGSEGHIAFGDPNDGGSVVRIAILDVVPPTTFAFRWTHAEGDVAAEGNSLLVVFSLSPSGTGTQLRMTETGFREMGWGAAVLKEQYQDHVQAWDDFIPRIPDYTRTLEAAP